MTILKLKCPALVGTMPVCVGLTLFCSFQKTCCWPLRIYKVTPHWVQDDRLENYLYKSIFSWDLMSSITRLIHVHFRPQVPPRWVSPASLAASLWCSCCWTKGQIPRSGTIAGTRPLGHAIHRKKPKLRWWAKVGTWLDIILVWATRMKSLFVGKTYNRLDTVIYIYVYIYMYIYIYVCVFVCEYT